MIIAQISDTHIALDTPDADQRILDFERTISNINGLDPPPDMVIHTGDIVQNGRLDEYALAAEVLQKAMAPVFVMVGNKDERSNFRSVFSSASYLTPENEFVAYSIEDFAVRIIVLDTLNPGSNKGNFCEKRIANLTEMLNADTNKPVAIFAHHPPFLVSEGPDPLHFESIEIMERFRHELLRYTLIKSIFCGHVHRGVAGYVGNIPVLVMPSIATTLRRGDYPPELETSPVYHVHEFEDDWGFSSVLHVVGD
ncbi:MAG: metallophosphoesterase [Rhizobiaceae bacterium]